MLTQQRIVAIPANLKTSLERDPIGFLRRMSATPVAAAYPFFTDRAAIRDCISKDLRNPIDDRSRKFAPNRALIPTPYARRYAHFDLGTVSDAASLTVCHSPQMLKAKPFIVVDLFARFVPEKERPIIIDDMEAIVYDMTAYGYPFGLVTADQYGSTQMLQHFHQRGYACGHLSIDRTTSKYLISGDMDKRVEKRSTDGDHMAPMMELKHAFTDRRILAPHYQPLFARYDDGEEEIMVPREQLELMGQTWVEKELSQLQIDTRKNLVEKLPGGTDDLAQSLAGAVFNLMVNEIDTGSASRVEGEELHPLTAGETDPFYAEHYQEEPLNPRLAPTSELEERLRREVSQADPFYERERGTQWP